MVWRNGPQGRVANSLLHLFDQVHARWPDRATGNDGTIGDTAHQQRHSDHNPDAHHIVRALDITHDPAHGFDSYKFADELREQRDRRISYVISNRRIMGGEQYAQRNNAHPWTWGHYGGEDAHEHHVHISVEGEHEDDVSDWQAPMLGNAEPKPPVPDEHGSVAWVQAALNGLGYGELRADGNAGPQTMAAIRAFQTARGITADGDAGPQTVAELDRALAGEPAPAPSGGQRAQQAILQAAGASPLAKVAWAGRGRAPIGYIRGMALAYADAYARLKADPADPAIAIMARGVDADLGDAHRDALVWYGSSRFVSRLGMGNVKFGADTLRHLFVLLTGLGMRESSGRFCEGRDMSARNVSGDSAEAGLFQQSWDSRAATPVLPQLLVEWRGKPSGGSLVDIFREGVTCTEAGLRNWGAAGSQGRTFQTLCKTIPIFACYAAAVGLRTIRTHWGPINRHEAELRPEADELFKRVQAIVDAGEAIA